MDIGLVQLKVHLGERAANFESVERLIQDAVSRDVHPRWLVLPEAWSTGFAYERLHDVVSNEADEEIGFMLDMSQRYAIGFVGGSVLTRVNGTIMNRAHVITPQGDVIATYDKIHIYCKEAPYMSGGDTFSTFHIEGVPCAGLVCYDLRFCEHALALTLMGTKIIFACAQWPVKRIGQWDLLLQARAVENKVFMIGCNCALDDGGRIGGNSLVVDPDGRILTRTDGAEQLVTVSLDVDLVDASRNKAFAIHDRRPELYAPFNATSPDDSKTVRPLGMHSNLKEN